MNKLSDGELDALKRAGMEKQHLEDDQRQFFNQPRAAADFDYWSKMTHWTLDEAIALSFGKAPEVVNEKSLKGGFRGYRHSCGSTAGRASWPTGRLPGSSCTIPYCRHSSSNGPRITIFLCPTIWLRASRPEARHFSIGRRDMRVCWRRTTLMPKRKMSLSRPRNRGLPSLRILPSNQNSSTPRSGKAF